MATDKRVTIAVIGAGVIGPRHAKSVQQCPEARLVCVVDPQQVESIAQNLSVPGFRSIADMLEAGCVPDAAIVCTPNSTHVGVSLELLSAGINVLVEKPVATDVKSGEQLVQAARSSGKALLVGHHRRFNPYVVAAKEALEHDAIGKPIAVSGLWTTYKPSSYFKAPAQWRASSESGGGPILINLVHEVDMLQYLLGPIVRVHAEQTVSHRGLPVEEGAAILLRFASGVVGTFFLSDATPSAHSFEGGTGENPIIPQSGKDFYRIFGSEGTLSVGDMKVTTYEVDSAKSWSSTTVERPIEVGNEIPFDAQVENLVRVVRSQEAPRCTGEDGLRALVVCEAVKEALASGNAVNIRASRL